MYVNVTCEKRYQVLSHYCTASNESWGGGGGARNKATLPAIQYQRFRDTRFSPTTVLQAMRAGEGEGGC